MDASSADPTATATRPSNRSARGRSSKPRKAETAGPTASRPAPKGTSAPPFLPIDVELLEDMRDLASRKVRAIVRDKPMVAMGGAFAAGFLLGGGWRTRVGRLLLFAANRYLVFQAAKRELGV